MWKALRQLKDPNSVKTRGTMTTLPTELYQLLMKRLEDTETKLLKTTIDLTHVMNKYTLMKEKLNKSQLANSMLRRLHSNERTFKFHKWLKIIEWKKPGWLMDFLSEQVGSYMDYRTLVIQRCTCKIFRDRLPKHIYEIAIRHSYSDQTNETNKIITNTNKNILDDFLKAMTKLTNAEFIDFNTTATAMLFASGIRSKYLLVLDLSGSNIGAVAASELGRGSYPSLKMLNIENNNIGCEGLLGLFNPNGMGNTKTFQCLYLASNQLSTNRIGTYDDVGLTALGKCLTLCSETIEILDLNNNGIDDGGLFAITSGLEKRKNPLTKLIEFKLNFGHSGKNRLNVGISDQGAMSLSRLLKQRLSNSTLQLVDLQNHRISSAGVISLITAIHGSGNKQRSNSSVGNEKKKGKNGSRRKESKLSQLLPENSDCCLMLHGNTTIGETVIRPITKSMYWNGSAEYLRCQISEHFGIWKRSSSSDQADYDKQEFKRKVRSRLEQKRRIHRL